MRRNLEKAPATPLNKSWVEKGYTSLLSLLPKWDKRKNISVMLFNKKNFINLEDIKEKTLLLEQYRILTEQVNKISEN